MIWNILMNEHMKCIIMMNEQMNWIIMTYLQTNEQTDIHWDCNVQMMYHRQILLTPYIII